MRELSTCDCCYWWETNSQRVQWLPLMMSVEFPSGTKDTPPLEVPPITATYNYWADSSCARSRLLEGKARISLMPLLNVRSSASSEQRSWYAGGGGISGLLCLKCIHLLLITIWRAKGKGIACWLFSRHITILPDVWSHCPVSPYSCAFCVPSQLVTHTKD